MTSRFILAQISDTHVRADDGGAAAQNLRRCLEAAASYRADAALLTGDLVNDARDDEYAVLAAALSAPPLPVFALPGNHDDRALIREHLPDHAYLPGAGHLSYVLEHLPVRIVCVDQIVEGETHGALTPEQAEWLDLILAARPDVPTLLALHHPPFSTYDVLFDQIGLKGGDRFAEIVAKHRQVQRIICGHHHRAVVGQVAHAPVIVAPSSAWTYGLAVHDGQPIAPRTAEPPGWALHVFSASAGFATHFFAI